MAEEDEEESEILPDGNYVANKPLKLGNYDTPCDLKTNAAVFNCQYVGSFAVAGQDHESRAEFVRNKLHKLSMKSGGKNVVMVLALSGIKIYSVPDHSLEMAHAVRRVSYATCDPGHRLFAFVAREPKGHFSLQYCHTFLTPSPQKAEELNNLVGNVFKLAFLQQIEGKSNIALQAGQPTFNSLLQEQLNNRFNNKNEDDSKANGQSKCASDGSNPCAARQWAKQQQNHHKEPITDMNLSETRHMSPTIMTKYTIGTGDISAVRKRPETLSLSDYVPASRSTSSCSSSDDNNVSPLTDNNRNNAKYDKPSMNVEKVHVQSLIGRPDLLACSNDFRQDSETSSISDVTSSSMDSLKNDLDSMSSSTTISPNKKNKHNKKATKIYSEKCVLYDKKSDQCSISPSSSSPTNLQKTNIILDNNKINSYKNERYQLNSSTSGTNKLKGSTSSLVSPPPPLPARHDSLNCEELHVELKGVPWYQAGIPREIALEILAREPVGAFMVRKSTTRPHCYALSLRVPIHFQPSGIAHYLILNTPRGFKIKGFMKEFSTLTALITHHSVMPELLPCPLSLSRYNASFTNQDNQSQDYDDDDDDDPDYETLSDFRKIMADLNI